MGEEVSGCKVAKTKCRVCGNEDVSVFPAGADPDTLECDRCHAPASEAIQYIAQDGTLLEEGEG